MSEKTITFNLDDPRSEKIAEALSNKTCKKILALLSEKELNASELANKLKAPLNTIGYNLEKLIQSGLVEKTNKKFWSIKGKKVESYKLANQKIIISPRKISIALLPAIIITFLASLIIKLITPVTKLTNQALQTSDQLTRTPNIAIETSKAAPEIMDYASESTQTIISTTVASNSLWLWFLLGALFALTIFLIWNWKKL